MSENFADQPIDGRDVALLGELAHLYDTVDPVPAELVERLLFSAALDEVFTELAEMTRAPVELTGARSETGVRAETMTFSAECLTVMVTVTRMGPDRVRLDGWVAPQAPLPVRLRTAAGRIRTVADADGRFSFEDLPTGYVQLAFGAGGDDDAGQVVVTPSFEL